MGLEKEKSLSDDLLKMYLNEIKQYQLLTEHEEKELFYKYQKGDKLARKKIIESNLKLVVSIAKNYQNQNMPFLDIIQEGNIGLFKAIDNFDLNKGYRFSTYATRWIKQSIIRGIDNKSRSIRIPVYYSEKIYTYKKIDNELRNLLNRNPLPQEIAEKMNIPVNDVLEMIDIAKGTVSLNSFLDNNDNDCELTLENIIVSSKNNPETDVILLDLNKQIQALFHKTNLSEKEKYILINRFELGGKKKKTLEEIGKKYGCTRERVRQIEKSALTKLKLSKEIEEFVFYMESPETSQKNLYDFRKQYRMQLYTRKK